MFKIAYDKKMTLVQGDTAIFTVGVDNYTFVEGDIAYFTVKKDVSSTENIVQKVITTFEENTFKVFLDSTDTKFVDVGSYVYDIQLSLADGRVDTVVLPTKFSIIGGVTHE